MGFYLTNISATVVDFFPSNIDVRSRHSNPRKPTFCHSRAHRQSIVNPSLLKGWELEVAPEFRRMKIFSLTCWSQFELSLIFRSFLFEGSRTTCSNQPTFSLIIRLASPTGQEQHFLSELGLPGYRIRFWFKADVRRVQVYKTLWKSVEPCSLGISKFAVQYSYQDPIDLCVCIVYYRRTLSVK